MFSDTITRGVYSLRRCIFKHSLC